VQVDEEYYVALSKLFHAVRRLRVLDPGCSYPGLAMVAVEDVEELQALVHAVMKLEVE
jgi:hypothetical protein